MPNYRKPLSLSSTVQMVAARLIFLPRISPKSATIGHGNRVTGCPLRGRLVWVPKAARELLAIVKQTVGTLGYLELNYAKENGVPVASIQNQAGHFVQPSPASTAAAISAFNDALAKDVRTPIVDPPASAADAYPISGLTFILIPKDRSDTGEQQAIKDFVAFAISTGQSSAEELSYAKLPDSVQKQGQDLLSQLTANSQPLK